MNPLRLALLALAALLVSVPSVAAHNPPPPSPCFYELGIGGPGFAGFCTPEAPEPTCAVPPLPAADAVLRCTESLQLDRAGDNVEYAPRFVQSQALFVACHFVFSGLPGCAEAGH